MTPAPISVKRLRELLDKATPGPWSLDQYVDVVGCDDSGVAALVGDNFSNNGPLIVAAINALPALLQQLAEREAEVAFARETLAKALDVGGVSDEPLRTLAIRASNALYWRDQHRQEAERAREEARGLLRDVWNRDGGKECRCINISRDTEREYENGHCPHQRIAAFLAASGGSNEPR